MWCKFGPKLCSVHRQRTDVGPRLPASFPPFHRRVVPSPITPACQYKTFPATVAYPFFIQIFQIDSFCAP